jgi:superfamily II DNA or RNA helicase
MSSLLIEGIRIDQVLNWSPVESVATRNGVTIVRRAVPTHEFFSLWRRSKDDLRKAGVKLAKFQERWVVTWWLEGGDTPKAEEPDQSLELPAIDTAGLLEWQIKPVQRMLAAHRAGMRGLLDASDTGVGKTYIASGFARAAGQSIYAVCPKAVMSSWREAADHIGAHLIDAKNYEHLKKSREGVISWGEHGWPEWKLPKDTIIVFDEAHRCRSSDMTLNAKLLVMAKRQGFQVVMISATIAESPLHLRAVGYTLGLHNGKQWWDWIKSLGCYQDQWNGWNWDQNHRTMEKLHAKIFLHRGVRVRKDSVKNFPETIISADLIDCGTKVKKVLDDLLTRLDRIRAETENYAQSAMTAILAARREAEMMKAQAMVEMIEDGIAENQSVAVFVCFRETLDYIRSKFNCGAIYGGQDTEEREQVIRDFRDDKSDVIVCAIQAGGVGISLHGKRDRLALISPSFSAVEVVQALGRVNRAGGGRSTQRLLYAAGTIEQQICRAVRNKLHNLRALNDKDTAGAFAI